MRKIYLLIFLLSSLISTAQISINGPQVFGPENGGVLYPILQGSSGDFEFGGYPVPQISGIISSIDIDIDFTYSEGNTYASDLTFIVSKSPNVLDSANNLLQIGGYDQLASVILPWTCTNCGSSSVPIPMIAHLDFPTPIDFTDTNFIIWMGNGYLQATAIGTWSINNITFGGNGNLVTTNDLSFDVNVYPNPAVDRISFKSAELISKVEVFAITGQKVLETAMSNVQGSINIADLPQGTYVCKLSSENGARSTIRFVKN